MEVTPTVGVAIYYNSYIMTSNKNVNQAPCLQLTKSSTEEQIRQYFQSIVELNHSDEEFPVNLDDVWSLVYSRRQEAVRALTMKDSYFMQDVDYQVLRRNAQNSKPTQDIDYQFFHKNGENSSGGRPTIVYHLSAPCLEYLVVRKVRAVFEVYRQVFHRVAGGGVALIGGNKYYTLAEYCRMFNKPENSFYGLMASYREEFAMIGRRYYISRQICRVLELRQYAERMRSRIKEKGNLIQPELPFTISETNEQRGGQTYGK